MLRRSLLGLLSAIVLFATPALVLHADQRDLSATPRAPSPALPISGDYWALIIGIDKYQHAPKLRSAVKDATGVRDVLVSRYGFAPERVISLLDKQATRTNIEQELYRLGQLAKPDDSVLIYYAGHGQYDDEGRLGWWVPVEGQPNQPGTFITNASIRDYIAGMKARHVYLVADSCFSGTLFGQRTTMPVNEKTLAKLAAKRSRWGLTSGGTEPVADEGRAGHSVFAYHFITLLRENQEPYLVPSRIYAELLPLVGNNTDQTPRSEPLKGAGDEGGQFVFRLVSTSGGPVPAPSRPSPLAPSVPPPSAFDSEKQQAAYAARLEEDWATVQSVVAQKGMKAAKRLAALDKFLQMYPDDNPHAGEVEALKQHIQAEMQVASAPSYSAPRQAGRDRTGKDGAPMLLIPAGEFMMGSTEGNADEKPVHRVSLDAFYLDKFEVTNRLFQKFVQDTGYQTTAEKEGKAWAYVRDDKWEEVNGANWRKPEGGETVFVSNREEHPVVSVSWYDAEAYCRWAGKRLPTEAEYEYANRGGAQTTYWWGNGNPGSRRVANIADVTNKQRFPGRPWPIMDGYDDGYARTAPVGTFDPNAFGLHDTTGNVAEWTADWYGKNFYERSPSHNPIGPSKGEYRVIRGGSWSYEPAYVRSADRDGLPPALRLAIFGFRCAQDAASQEAKAEGGSEQPRQGIQMARVPIFDAPQTMRGEITGKDGAPMVLVPEGEFLYGDNNQRLSLPAFYMDKFEVTTKLYAAFLQATGRAAPYRWNEVSQVSDGDRPVIGVTWHDADAYCRYYGKRLPTEQEWEKAARGTDGRKYPWGNEEPTSRHAKYDTDGKASWHGYATLASVESYEAGKSPYGLYHMAGNVWEWTSSDYDGSRKVFRGGSWSIIGASGLRAPFRVWVTPSDGGDSLGFRCVQDVPQ